MLALPECHVLSYWASPSPSFLPWEMEKRRCPVTRLLLVILGRVWHSKCSACFCPYPLLGPFSSQKLPFTIPELVHASPCRSSDGVFYTGEYPCSLWRPNPASRNGDLGHARPTRPGTKGHTHPLLHRLDCWLTSLLHRPEAGYLVCGGP